MSKKLTEAQRAPIDQLWVIGIAEKLAKLADSLPEGSAMQKATRDRAWHYSDLVAEWQQHAAGRAVLEHGGEKT